MPVPAEGSPEAAAEVAAQTPAESPTTGAGETPAASAAASEPSRSYVATRRGITGWLAALVAVAGAAGFAVVLISGDGSNQPVLAAALAVVALLASLFAYRRVGRSSQVVLDPEGRLRLTFGTTQHEFDLASPATEVRMEARPGQSDWRVLVVRKGRVPLAITSASVDPVQFTDALRRWRPGL